MIKGPMVWGDRSRFSGTNKTWHLFLLDVAPFYSKRGTFFVASFFLGGKRLRNGAELVY